MGTISVLDLVKATPRESAAMMDAVRRTSNDLAKGSALPAGYQPIPGGKHGGGRKKEGNGWAYWYPNQASAGQALDHHSEQAAKHRQKVESLARRGRDTDDDAIKQHQAAVEHHEAAFRGTDDWIAGAPSEDPVSPNRDANLKEPKLAKKPDHESAVRTAVARVFPDHEIVRIGREDAKTMHVTTREPDGSAYHIVVEREGPHWVPEGRSDLIDESDEHAVRAHAAKVKKGMDPLDFLKAERGGLAVAGVRCGTLDYRQAPAPVLETRSRPTGLRAPPRREDPVVVVQAEEAGPTRVAGDGGRLIRPDTGLRRPGRR